MKKLFKNLGLILIVSFGIALLNSCVTETTGTVIVRNNAPYELKVDVTWGGATTNHERWVSPGSSTTYYSVPEGSVTVWSSDNGVTWLSDYIFLTAGQTYTYTLNFKKSDISYFIHNGMVSPISGGFGTFDGAYISFGGGYGFGHGTSTPVFEATLGFRLFKL